MEMFVFVLLQMCGFFNSLYWIILTSYVCGSVFVFCDFYYFLLMECYFFVCARLVFAELFWGTIWDLGWLSLPFYSGYLKAWLWLGEKPCNLICVDSCALPTVKESLWAFASQNTFSRLLYSCGVDGVAFPTRRIPCFWTISRYYPVSLKLASFCLCSSLSVIPS